MKNKTSPFIALVLGIILVVIGVSLPKNTDNNYNIVVIILGAIVLIISMSMLIKLSKEKREK